MRLCTVLKDPVIEDGKLVGGTLDHIAVVDENHEYGFQPDGFHVAGWVGKTVKWSPPRGEIMLKEGHKVELLEAQVAVLRQALDEIARAPAVQQGSLPGMEGLPGIMAGYPESLDKDG